MSKDTSVEEVHGEYRQHRKRKKEPFTEEDDRSMKIGIKLFDAGNSGKCRNWGEILALSGLAYKFCASELEQRNRNLEKIKNRKRKTILVEEGEVRLAIKDRLQTVVPFIKSVKTLRSYQLYAYLGANKRMSFVQWKMLTAEISVKMTVDDTIVRFGYLNSKMIDEDMVRLKARFGESFRVSSNPAFRMPSLCLTSPSTNLDEVNNASTSTDLVSNNTSLFDGSISLSLSTPGSFMTHSGKTRLPRRIVVERNPEAIISGQTQSMSAKRWNIDLYCKEKPRISRKPPPTGFNAHHTKRIFVLKEWQKLLSYIRRNKVNLKAYEPKDWENLAKLQQIETSVVGCQIQKDFYTYAVPNLDIIETNENPLELYLRDMGQSASILIYHSLTEVGMDALSEVITELSSRRILCTKTLSVKDWTLQFVRFLLSLRGPRSHKAMNAEHEEFNAVRSAILKDFYHRWISNTNKTVLYP